VQTMSHGLTTQHATRTHLCRVVFSTKHPIHRYITTDGAQFTRVMVYMEW